MFFINPIKAIWEYRQLLFFLTLRDIKVRYKQALLGIAWAVITPLLQALILTLVFGVFFKISDSQGPYLLLVYTGFIFWNFFSQSINTSTVALTGNYNLITKSSFPKEMLVLSTVLGRIPDLLASFLVLIMLLIFYQTGLSWMVIWILPLVLIELFLAIGISFFFASANVYFRDIAALTPFLMVIWLYITPIIYTFGSIPLQYQSLISLNPMVGIIEGFRNSLLFQQPPNFIRLSISIIFTITAASSGYLVFKRLERGFADTI